MFKFFDAIIDIVSSIFEFIINGIESVITFFGIVSSSIGIVARIPFFVPGVIGASVLVVLLVCTIKLIVDVVGALT